jgi:DNA-binding HxlR family transcriptional regulator
MRWADYDSTVCSVARTVEVLGDRWTLLVLRDVFNGIRRFADLSSHLGIARDVLAKRLAALVEEGLITRVPYREPGARTRYEYRLTDAGRELRPLLLALLEWGDRYRCDPAGPPAQLFHAECGAPVRVEVRCAEGHEIGPRTHLTAKPGPGSRLVHAAAPAEPAQPATVPTSSP